MRYAADLRGIQKAASILVSILGIKLLMGPSLMSECSLCFIQRYLEEEKHILKTGAYITLCSGTKAFSEDRINICLLRDIRSSSEHACL